MALISRASSLDGINGTFSIIEAPVPDIQAGGIVIKQELCGICGTDVHVYQGHMKVPAPVVLGHEIVGTVLAPAADGTGPAAGQPVAVHPATPVDDGSAPYPADRPNLSPAGTYLGSAARMPHTHGAFARRVALPARMLRSIPAGLPQPRRLRPSRSGVWR